MAAVSHAHLSSFSADALFPECCADSQNMTVQVAGNERAHRTLSSAAFNMHRRFRWKKKDS